MPEKDKLVPAVPAQEAPREPICKYCRHPIRPTCDPHNDHDYVHSESGYACCAKGTTFAEPQAGAQPECPGCRFVNRNHLYSCPARQRVKLQAGAQVPSQDEIGSILVAAIDRHITDESLRDLAVIAANGIYWRNQRIGELETHLNTIKSYATEAAKTPITREDMHDPLKAQTFYDEAKGLCRLVLSEIGK